MFKRTLVLSIRHLPQRAVLLDTCFHTQVRGCQWSLLMPPAPETHRFLNLTLELEVAQGPLEGTL